MLQITQIGLILLVNVTDYTEGLILLLTTTDYTDRTDTVGNCYRLYR